MFAGCTLLNFFLQCAGQIIWFGTMVGPNQVSVGEVWMWVVACPFMLLYVIRPPLPPWFGLIAMLLNASFYGGMGWFAWRMWTLMRRKRPE